MPALDFQFRDGGILFPHLGLWLDPHQAKRELVFVSHAHSDHIARHREVILTEPTARLMTARLGGRRTEHMMKFGEVREFSGGDGVPFRITLLPAGHILGSAMSLVECEGESVLYTGDFKLRPGLAAEVCEPRPADTLIMETTFGRPQYRFPDARDVMRDVIRFCEETLRADASPVLHAYSLGKSQELLCGLSGAGLPVVLHDATHKMTRIYEQFGHRFPAYEKHEAGQGRGKVVISPPAARTELMLALGPVRRAMITGWAIDPGCRFRYQCDAAFPLSDHADFPDLIEFVQQVQPQRVFTLHGFAADFAGTLRGLGFDARALGMDEQLELVLKA